MSSRRRPVSRSGAGVDEQRQMEMPDAEPSSETAAKASGRIALFSLRVLHLDFSQLQAHLQRQVQV